MAKYVTVDTYGNEKFEVIGEWEDSAGRLWYWLSESSLGPWGSKLAKHTAPYAPKVEVGQVYELADSAVRRTFEVFQVDGEDAHGVVAEEDVNRRGGTRKVVALQSDIWTLLRVDSGPCTW